LGVRLDPAIRIVFEGYPPGATAERYVAQFLLPAGLCRFLMAIRVFQARHP
jgi:hypothetical protein